VAVASLLRLYSSVPKSKKIPKKVLKLKKLQKNCQNRENRLCLTPSLIEETPCFKNPEEWR